jgi:hypothetical protein
MFGVDSFKTFFRALTALARVSIMAKPREQAAKLAKTAVDCHGGHFLSASDQQIIISQEPQHQLARLRMFTAMQYLLGARTVKGHLLKLSSTIQSGQKAMDGAAGRVTFDSRCFPDGKGQNGYRASFERMLEIASIITQLNLLSTKTFRRNRHTLGAHAAAATTIPVADAVGAAELLLAEHYQTTEALRELYTKIAAVYAPGNILLFWLADF